MSKLVTKTSSISRIGCFLLYNITYLIRRLTTSTTATIANEESLLMSHTSYEDNKGEKEASPLLVLHGLFSAKSQWSAICEQIQKRLTPKRKIIAVDLRNHGDSPHTDRHGYLDMSNDIHNFINRMSIGAFCLLGHGMGGMAAMAYTLRYPGTVKKIIVVDIAPVKYHNSKMLDYLISAMEGVKIPNGTEMDVGMSLANAQLAKKIRSATLRDFILSNLVKSPDGRVNLPAIKDHLKDIVSFPDLKGDYKNPSLFIAGKQSQCFRVPEVMTSVRKYFPTSTIETIDDAGHNVHNSHRDQFVNLCAQYLNDVVGCA